MEQLSTFLSTSDLGQEDREILWGLLAQSHRAALRKWVEVVPKKTPLSQLLSPFVHFLSSAGVKSDGLTILEKHLRGRRSEFPFGVLELDAAGTIVHLGAASQSDVVPMTASVHKTSTR